MSKQSFDSLILSQGSTPRVTPLKADAALSASAPLGAPNGSQLITTTRLVLFVDFCVLSAIAIWAMYEMIRLLIRGG